MVMWIITTVAACLFPAYFFVDVNYFIRSAFTVLFAKTRKKIGFLDTSTIYGVVIPSDVDFLLTHMNNARFLREMDFARIDHGTRSGFMQEAMRRGGMILLSASFIRYRLPLPVFSRYKVVTNIVWWDEKNVYLTHKIITINDNIIRAIVYARSTCLRVNPLEIAEKINPGVERPDSVAPDYSKWMETLELSSQLMKANGAGVDNSLQQCSVQDDQDTKTNGNGNAVVMIANDKANSNEVENLMLQMRKD
ncbi:unnamed protein product [Orchesella dallaii]|uniref:Protein THEM6 n=1 Tax=Orchesella dallaii TaxID=48710 RepID=A0ABP1QJ50_9HEXA